MAFSRSEKTPLAKYSWARSLAKTTSWNTSSTRSALSPSRFSAISTSSGWVSFSSGGATGSIWDSTSITLISSSEWCAVIARPDSEIRWGIGSPSARQTPPMV